MTGMEPDPQVAEEEGIITDDQGRKFFRLKGPTWQDTVEFVRKFSVGSQNFNAISPLLDELKRIAKIADGDDPEAIIAKRKDL